MNKPCARCNKTVYPVEKLTCLDKTWHKGCFTCETCNMKLTMKNYKGYNKLPYCNTHYPTTKFTAVADTPENLRLKKQTAQQSNIVYHAEFNANLQGQGKSTDVSESARERGQFTAVQSDPKPPPPQQPQYRSEPPAPAMPEPEPYMPPAPASNPGPPPPPTGPRYVAVYDYSAADDDEVSFQEGDIIINAEVIDEGWMTGTVQRTGESGMLPSNYVEKQ